MTEPADGNPLPHELWLQRGQALEAEQRIKEAVAAYDHAISLVRAAGNAAEPSARLALALAWMNRGNALQKRGTPSTLADSIRAYDEAIVLFRTLPLEKQPRLRNHLGAAWLNRGHALMVVADSAAVGSFELAIAELGQIPLDADPFFRLNFAGAHTNLAHALLASAPDRAAVSARAALAAIGAAERAHEAFAGLSLRARRALVMALGALLHLAERSAQPISELATEATDVIDDGLAVAAELERSGRIECRPLAVRLFHLGVQIYGAHQPHFLDEFVTETLATPGFGSDAEFRAIAETALSQTLDRVQRSGIFLADTPDAKRRLETVRSLRATQEHLSTLRAQISTHST